MDNKMFLLVLVLAAAFYEGSAISCKEKKEIVDMHNHLRKQVAQGKLGGQPKAADMMMMVWDDKLAQLAQNWANGQQFMHNPDREDSRFDVGENIYTSSSTEADTAPEWTKAITGWFDEHKSYKYKPFARERVMIGHYTQVVWGVTTQVGCGFVSYREGEWYTKLYVCNYGPAGNMLGDKPYNTGKGCENLCCKGDCKRPYGPGC